MFWVRFAHFDNLKRFWFEVWIAYIWLTEKPIISCSAEVDAADIDSCCAETFGGLVLATQYWNTWTGLEAEGQRLPKDSWTIHGLWPDFCNGSYTQYCDLSRQYDPEPFPNTINGEPDGKRVCRWNLNVLLCSHN